MQYICILTTCKMPKRKLTNKKGEIYEVNVMEITSVPQDVDQDLRAIAYNIGRLSLSAFLKPKLREIRDSYPLNMRQPKNAI